MSVNVTIYPHKLSEGSVEIEQIQPTTILHYALQQDPDLLQRPHPLFSCCVNGELVPYVDWGNTRLHDGDHLECQIEPQGIESVLYYALVAIVAVAYSYQQMSNLPNNLGDGSTPEGSSIYRADLQANRAKKNGIIPEIFGALPRFPDLILPIRRVYIDHEEWLYVGLSVGVGTYDISTSDIRIGETAISNYSGDVTFNIVSPGGDVSAIIAAEHWYQTKEIGATAGTSGLELKSAVASFDAGWRYDFAATELSIYDIASPRNGVSWPISAGEHIYIADTNNNGRFRVVSVNSPDNEATMQKLRLASSGGFEPTLTWEDDPDWTGFTGETDVEATITYSGSEETNEWSSWFNVLPEGETTDEIEFDYRFPRGLGFFEDDGSITNHTVEIAYEYRAVGGSSTQVTLSKTEATRDERAYTVTINVGSAIEPQIRFRRNTTEIDDSKYLEDVEVVRVKGKLTAPSSYADVTTAFFAVKGTNAIASTAENKINIDVQRKLPTVAAYKTWKDGGLGSPEPALTAHQQIGAAYLYLTEDAGYSLDDVDVDAIKTLQDTWDSRGDTFAAEIGSEYTLFDLQKRVLAVGYAEPTIEDGLMTAKRDGVRSTYDYLYTPDKILPPGISRRGSLYDPDENDGVEVEYFDTSTKQNKTVTYRLAAAGDPATPTNPKKIRAFGITDETKAWRFGSIERRRMHFKAMQLVFETEMDGLNSAYLDAPAIADDLLENGITGFVTAEQSGNVLTLDTDLTFVSGATHKIAISKKDGSFSGLYTATAGASANEVQLDSALDFTPDFDGSHENPVFAFGTEDDWAVQVIVRSIEPVDSDRVKLICDEYIEGIWDDIDGSPP